MLFDVSDIEFDYDDVYADGYKLTFDDEIAHRDIALGIWEANDAEEMMDKISDATGYAIKNIYYDVD